MSKKEKIEEVRERGGDDEREKKKNSKPALVFALFSLSVLALSSVYHLRGRW